MQLQPRGRFQRTEPWREAAHDLRGTVGAVKLAANALGHAVATPELPAFVNLVGQSADSLPLRPIPNSLGEAPTRRFCARGTYSITY